MCVPVCVCIYINIYINTNNIRANSLRLILPAPRTNIMLPSFACSVGKMWNACLLMLYLLHLCIFLNDIWLVFV